MAKSKKKNNKPKFNMTVRHKERQHMEQMAELK
jgi:hypothetical protein